MKWRLGAMIAVAWGVAGCSQPAENQAQLSAEAASALAAASAAEAASADWMAHQGAWQYSEETGALGQAPSQIACTASTNDVRLDFPYHEQKADLCIRRKAGGKTDAYITLEDEGQFASDCVSGCSIPVQFDSGHVERLAADDEATDGTDKTMFFTGNPSRLISALLKAKTATFELTFFQAGTQQMAFSVAGLKWPLKS
jgi:hypothetical protein